MIKRFAIPLFSIFAVTALALRPMPNNSCEMTSHWIGGVEYANCADSGFNCETCGLLKIFDGGLTGTSIWACSCDGDVESDGPCEGFYYVDVFPFEVRYIECSTVNCGQTCKEPLHVFPAPPGPACEC